MGPPIGRRLAGIPDEQLTKLIREGLPTRGMPATAIPAPEMTPLTRFLREIQARAAARPVVRKSVQTTDGKTLDGIVMNEGVKVWRFVTPITGATCCAALAIAIVR